MEATETVEPLKQRIEEAQQRRDAAFRTHVAPLEEEIKVLKEAAGSKAAQKELSSAAVPLRTTLLAAAGGLALAIVLWGGYSHHWPWTGIDGETATLWDWLHLLLLPLVFAFLPTWVSRETRMDPRTKQTAFTVLLLFCVLVLSGYAIPWAWTGFTGNTLWDWLSLIVLPLTLLLMPGFADLRARWGARHSAAAGTLLAVFVAIVLGGYLGHWVWTGFTGNTLWDWFNLLLLPLLLPTVVIPALKPTAMGRIVVVSHDEEGRAGDSVPAERRRGSRLARRR
ncbi:MAG TPA: hypothetical protein VGF95_15255 [Solirubrobacteraceae bacterium]|jgi:hypothetical protein